MKPHSIILNILVLGAFLLPACTSSAPETGVPETGTLTGHVTIGPLMPVEEAGKIEPTLAATVYAGRQIVVFEPDGTTEVMRLKIDAQGDYRADLPAGMYVVDINHAGIDFAKELPKQIEIKAGETTVLDIAIDTGIR